MSINNGKTKHFCVYQIMWKNVGFLTIFIPLFDLHTFSPHGEEFSTFKIVEN